MTLPAQHHFHYDNLSKNIDMCYEDFCAENREQKYFFTQENIKHTF